LVNPILIQNIVISSKNNGMKGLSKVASMTGITGQGGAYLAESLLDKWIIQ